MKKTTRTAADTRKKMKIKETQDKTQNPNKDAEKDRGP
jgi:hypothetical protein